MIATISMEGVHVEMHVIRLTFDYVKKNRRERAYIMEDLSSAKVIIIKKKHLWTVLRVVLSWSWIFVFLLFFQEFEELLRPALEANLAALKMKDLMHVSVVVLYEAWPLQSTCHIQSRLYNFLFSNVKTTACRFSAWNVDEISANQKQKWKSRNSETSRTVTSILQILKKVSKLIARRRIDIK